MMVDDARVEAVFLAWAWLAVPATVPRLLGVPLIPSNAKAASKEVKIHNPPRLTLSLSRRSPHFFFQSLAMFEFADVAYFQNIAERYMNRPGSTTSKYMCVFDLSGYALWMSRYIRKVQQVRKK
jgi:hypothetical protein